MSTRTSTAYAALGTALLYLISVPIGSFNDAPDAGASGAAVLHYLDAHRSGVLAACVLNGIAWCALMPVAFAGLRQLLRGGSADAAATVALICAAVESALIGLGLVFGLVAAFEAPQLAPEDARLLGDAFSLATGASAWPTVPCVVALALAWRGAAGRLPRTVSALAALAVALHAIASFGFARSGALAPDHIPGLAPISFALLMAAVGVALLRRPELAPGRATATALAPAGATRS
jgi:hypothetical protein